MRAAQAFGAAGLMGACADGRPFAPSVTRVPLVVFLFTRLTEPVVQTSIATTKKTLAEFGYVEGQTIRYDGRDAVGDPGRFPALADEVTSLSPDVIVCQNPQAAQALMRATSAIPIVFVGTNADVLDTGLVKDLGRPDRNLTGLTGNGPEIGSKRLQILREAVPTVRRVAVLQDQGEPGTEMRDMQRVAPLLGIELVPVYLRSGSDLDAALQAAAAAGVDALVQTLTTQFITGIADGSARIAAFAIERKWPTMGVAPTVGGLMSYSAVIVDAWPRAARFIDRILKGASPADLPIEGPTSSGFAINLCTASKIGITIPQSMVAQATNVVPCTQ